jgi:DNA gyrase/topoisomerase IV subunit A
VRWTREFARRYFTTTTAAIRAADPNHLVLGCRCGGIVGAHVLAGDEAITLRHPDREADEVELAGRHGAGVLGHLAADEGAAGLTAAVGDALHELLDVIRTDGKCQIFVATRDGMAVRFHESDVRPMGRVARGVRGVNLRKGDEVVSVCAVSEEGTEKILSVSEKGFGKQTQVNSYRLTNRGGVGVINMKTTDKTGKVVAAFPVEDDSEIMIITQQAKLIRLGVDKIRETGRSAQGVTLIKCGDDDLVTSASLLAVDAEEEE